MKIEFVIQFWNMQWVDFKIMTGICEKTATIELNEVIADNPACGFRLVKRTHKVDQMFIAAKKGYNI